MTILTVMTFNLRVNTVTDLWNAWPRRIHRVADVFARHAPDVAGTQEGLPDMLADLKQRLPAEYARIGFGRHGTHTDEHCAIFYRTDRLRLFKHGQFWLSETPEEPSRHSDAAYVRFCTWGEFAPQSQQARRFRVYNTHFDHASAAPRIFSARLLWRMIATAVRDHPVPVLLTGDFNAPPQEASMCFLRGETELNGERSGLRDVATTAGLAVGRTYHGFRGGTDGTPIDYIFMSPEWQVEGVAVDRTRTQGRYPSDHYPLMARLNDVFGPNEPVKTRS